MAKSVTKRTLKQDVKPEKPASKEAAYLFLPWSCKHYPDRSKIEAYLPGRDWETIAEIPANPGVDTRLVSEFIVRAVNGLEARNDLIDQMVAALELCLACENLTWEGEQEAQILLSRIKVDASLD